MYVPKQSTELARYVHTDIFGNKRRRNILTVHRETLTQYITFNRGGRGESVLLYCSLWFCNRDVLHQPLCVDSD